MKKMLLAGLAIGLVIVVGLQQAQAVPIPIGELIVNGGFGSSASPSLAGWTPAGATNTNARSANNTIDNTGGNAGFNNFFGPGSTGSTNAFAVLGDVSGTIGGDFESGISSISQTFTLPTVQDGSYIKDYNLIISFRSAFDGRDSVGTSTVHDIFSARFFSDTLSLLLFSQDSSGFPGGSAPSASQPNNQLTNDPFTASILGLLPGTYTLIFELDEKTGTGNNLTNTAAGIDNVSITATAEAMVPEPSTILLLGAGLGGLALMRRKK